MSEDEMMSPEELEGLPDETKIGLLPPEKNDLLDYVRMHRIANGPFESISEHTYQQLLNDARAMMVGWNGAFLDPQQSFLDSQQSVSRLHRVPIKLRVDKVGRKFDFKMTPEETAKIKELRHKRLLENGEAALNAAEIILNKLS